MLSSDPAVTSAGVDVGFAADAKTLRAPDVAVGDFGDGLGWAQGAPPLAVEYADQGQDEADLRVKVGELLRAGCRHVWVVRLTGPRRVEVYDGALPMRLVYPGEDLVAPGVLQNPVPVTAMYDPSAAQDVVLRNLLNRLGYKNLEHVVSVSHAKGHEIGREEGREEGREQGREEGRRTAILAVLDARGVAVPDEIAARISTQTQAEAIDRLLARAAVVTSADALFEP